MPTVSGFATTNAVVTTGWTNPTNAYTDNAVYATATIAAKNTIVSSRFGGFGVAALLPAGATINSVTVNAEMKVSTTASIAQLGVQAQSPSGTNRGTQTLNTAEPAADTVIVQTVLSSTFAWTAADLADGTLFAVIEANQGNSTTSCTYSLDYVQVVVDYSDPPPAGTPTWVSGTTLAGATDTSAVVTLPSSLAANDVVVVVLAKENAEAVTPASGYALPTGYSVPTNTNSVYVYWSRMVGGETGTITFSWTTAAWRMAAAHRITGAIPSGEPIGGTNTATGALATTPAVSLTGINLPALLLWFGARPGSTAGSWTMPTGFTLHGDLGNMVNATGAATATSSGSITGSYIASGAMDAGLLSILGGTGAPGAVVVTAQPIPPQRPTVIVGWRPTGAAAAPAATPPRPLIIPAQEAPQPPAVVVVGRPPTSPAAAPAAIPPRPLIVAGWPLPAQPAAVLIQQPLQPADRPPAPVVVAAAQPPTPQPLVVITRPPAEPPPSQINPIPAKIIGAQPLPRDVSPAFVSRTPAAAVAAPTGTPLEPLIIGAVLQPQPTFYIFISKTAVEDFTDDPTPPVPTIAVGASLVGGGQIFIRQTFVAPPPSGPAVPPKPLIIPAQPLPAEVQAPFRHQARVEPTPPIPPRPLIIVGQPRPADTQPPFRYQTRVDFTAAPDTGTPTRPLIVGAQQAPIEVPPPFRHQARVADPPATAIRPLVVSAVQSMPASGAAWVSRTTPLEPYRPATVVAGGPERPPEKASIVIHRPWGPPPPSVNRPPIQVITYRHIPPPAGRSRIGRGFKEAFAAHLLPVTARPASDRYTADAGSGQVTARPGVDQYRIGVG